MLVKKVVEKEINRIIDILRNDQTADGSWNYPFETGMKTDAYMIILLRSLEIDDEELIQSLVNRILSMQEEDGSWKLYKDEEHGNLSATIEANYALLYSGYRTKDDPEIIAAKQQIFAMGGMEKSHLLTKVLLTLTGQYKWPAFFPVPVEIMLLPPSFPINLYHVSLYSRIHNVPLLILADKKFRLKTKQSPDLGDLFLTREDSDDDYLYWYRNNQWHHLLNFIQNELKKIIGFPSQMHALAIKQAENYMLKRIEPDGTFYSFISSTFLMIFALLSLGYKKNDPIITNAISGLKSMATKIKGQTHMQFTTANVWNTSLISYSLQAADIPSTDPMIQKANHYLRSRQHTRNGDWSIHNPNITPGGWGFSHINTINPDVDDTTASMRAIMDMAKSDPRYRQGWDRGINWLLSMQNHDGGWAAFEKNVYHPLLKFIPIQGIEYLLADPSTADLTGRTLEFIGNYTNLYRKHPAIKNGVNWLVKHQEKNGSWFGRWGICYIYGTWAAVTGMVGTGISTNHPSIQKALKWLRGIQNPDGGWGESCNSDKNRIYTPLEKSTVTQTAWALDTLISCANEPTPEMEAGVQFLIEASNQKDWTHDYPKGQALPGAIYFHYHSYDYIFPLLALSNYRKKFTK